MPFTIAICPVCREQINWDDDVSPGCTHLEYGGWVDAIEVDVTPDVDQLRSRCDLAVFRLQEDRREQAFRDAERAWYANLSVADRFWEDQRRKRVHREGLADLPRMDAINSVIQETWQGAAFDALFSARSYVYSRAPSPDALDEWLVRDGVPEVETVLGFGPVDPGSPGYSYVEPPTWEPFLKLRSEGDES